MSLQVHRFGAAVEAKDEDSVRATTERIERALLGGCMTVGLVPRPPLPEAADFLTEAHRVAWEAIVALADAGKPCDAVLTLWELEKAGTLGRAGGETYLAGHLDSTNCADLNLYAEAVKEAARLRKLARLSQAR